MVDCCAQVGNGWGGVVLKQGCPKNIWSRSFYTILPFNNDVSGLKHLLGHTSFLATMIIIRNRIHFQECAGGTTLSSGLG